MFDDFNLLDDMTSEENDFINEGNYINPLDITESCSLPELDHITQVPGLDNEFETSYHNNSEISFGNMYDDRADKFISDCNDNGVELPSSVTNHGTVIDRAYSGGFTSIDKSIIENELDSLHNSGNLSDNTYNDLKSRLWSC